MILEKDWKNNMGIKECYRIEQGITYKLLVDGVYCEFYLYNVESFMWRKSYVIHLKRDGENSYHTFRFSHQPLYFEVEDMYIRRYIKHELV